MYYWQKSVSYVVFSKKEEKKSPFLAVNKVTNASQSGRKISFPTSLLRSPIFLQSNSCHRNPLRLFLLLVQKYRNYQMRFFTPPQSLNLPHLSAITGAEHRKGEDTPWDNPHQEHGHIASRHFFTEFTSAQKCQQSKINNFQSYFLPNFGNFKTHNFKEDFQLLQILYRVKSLKILDFGHFGN